MSDYILFRLKILLGHKSSIFWACVFPLILTLFFSFAFNSFLDENLGKQDVIKIAFDQDYESSDLINVYKAIEV
ncbi:MAG: hypothetical protein ACRCTA_08090, partial [Bacilli bacterium]